MTQLTITPEDRILHAIHLLSSALKDIPSTLCNSQLSAIEDIRNIFSKCITNETHTLPKVHRPRPFTKNVQKQDTKPRLMHPETTAKPALRIEGTPISKGSHTK